jgi:hypothetical protein
VYHASAGFFLKKTLAGIFFTLIGIGFFAALLGDSTLAVLPWCTNGSTSVTSNQFDLIRAVDFGLALVVLLGGLWQSRNLFTLSRLREQMLVLTPDGFVVNITEPTAYAFATMQTISARWNKDKVTFTLQEGQPARTRGIEVDNRFGNTKQIANDVLAMRNAWKQAHGQMQPS